MGHYPHHRTLGRIEGVHTFNIRFKVWLLASRLVGESQRDLYKTRRSRRSPGGGMGVEEGDSINLVLPN